MVAGDEARGCLAADRRERRRELADQQVARGLAAHVQLVAHVEALRRRARRRRPGRDARAGARAADPSSSRKKRSRSIDSSSPTPNQSVRPGPSFSVEYARRARRLVLHHPDGHRRRADAGHRADVVVLVAGLERDLAALEQPLGLARGRAPSPRTRAAATQRAALRVADLRPLDRRPGVQQHAVARARRRRRRPARRSARAGAARSIRSTAAALRRGDRVAVPPPQARQQRRRASASPPAGGRQSTSTTGAPWARSASANVDSPRLTAATRVRDRRHRRQGPSALVQWRRWQISQALAAAVRAAPGLRGKRDVQADRAARAPASTATTRRSSRTATDISCVCGEAISPPFVAADPFGAGAAAVVTNVSDVRAMGGRPLGARRHAGQP